MGFKLYKDYIGCILVDLDINTDEDKLGSNDTQVTIYLYLFTGLKKAKLLGQKICPF